MTITGAGDLPMNPSATSPPVDPDPILSVDKRRRGRPALPPDEKEARRKERARLNAIESRNRRKDREDELRAMYEAQKHARQEAEKRVINLQDEMRNLKSHIAATPLLSILNPVLAEIAGVPNNPHTTQAQLPLLQLVMPLLLQQDAVGSGSGTTGSSHTNLSFGNPDSASKSMMPFYRSSIRAAVDPSEVRSQDHPDTEEMSKAGRDQNASHSHVAMDQNQEDLPWVAAGNAPQPASSSSLTIRHTPNTPLDSPHLSQYDSAMQAGRVIEEKRSLRKRPLSSSDLAFQARQQNILSPAPIDSDDDDGDFEPEPDMEEGLVGSSPAGMTDSVTSPWVGEKDGRWQDEEDDDDDDERFDFDPNDPELFEPIEDVAIPDGAREEVQARNEKFLRDLRESLRVLNKGRSTLPESGSTIDKEDIAKQLRASMAK